MYKWEKYKQQIIDFKEYLENQLDENFDKKDTELYPYDFKVSFKEKSCKIGFGADEYYIMLDMLQQIIDEF